MLLSIDSEKIREQLALDGEPAYTVTASNLESVPVKEPPPSPVNIVSVVMTIPPDLEMARARLLALRQRLFAGGQTPLSGDQLDRELNSTRGR